jgi:hypothetical protein
MRHIESGQCLQRKHVCADEYDCALCFVELAIVYLLILLALIFYVKLHSIPTHCVKDKQNDTPKANAIPRFISLLF